MNLNELKTAWKAYDRKIQSTQLINEKIIVSMIAERSGNRFAKVKIQYTLGFIWMFICFAAGCAVMIGNPFDYDFTIQYAPIAIYCFCMIILLSGIAKAFYDLQHITLSQHNLDTALKKIIDVYERPQQFFKYTLYVFLFTSVILFPFSFLPKSIERNGLWMALAERLIPISISVVLLFVAHKLGAFKDQHGKKFKEDLSELEELKRMSLELRTDS